MTTRLQNYHPLITTLPLRKRGSAYSPDDETLCDPLWSANFIYMGAGSPTYAAKQLTGSFTWHVLQARQRQGAAVGLASASAISAGTHVLPVYEIFKAGHELGWQPGLNLLGPFGLDLVIISHWNNTEGGADLDTSHCFIGQDRFDQMLPLLPPDAVILGLDEHTGLILDFIAEEAAVVGRDSVHILRGGVETSFRGGESFNLNLLGDYHPLTDPGFGIPDPIWQRATRPPDPVSDPNPPAAVQNLSTLREVCPPCARLADSRPPAAGNYYPGMDRPGYTHRQRAGTKPLNQTARKEIQPG